MRLTLLPSLLKKKIWFTKPNWRHVSLPAQAARQQIGLIVIVGFIVVKGVVALFQWHCTIPENCGFSFYI